MLHGRRREKVPEQRTECPPAFQQPASRIGKGCSMCLPFFFFSLPPSFRRTGQVEITQPPHTSAFCHVQKRRTEYTQAADEQNSMQKGRRQHALKGRKPQTTLFREEV